MKLKVLGSSSAGNCYILGNDTEALILEAGVNPASIKKALNFDLSNVWGCLISHEHGDHAGFAQEYAKLGINIYTSYGTAVVKNLDGYHRFEMLKSGEPVEIGPFKVLPFSIEHDCAEPLGFLIQHEECGTVLFATDTYYLRYKFPGLNNILIEANYDESILNERFESGKLHKTQRDRVIESHMSIETCMETLRANDLSAVNNIVLIHLSDGNSNAKEFQDRVKNATRKAVHVADKGLEIEFNKTPF